MKILADEGVVLQSRPFSEYDVILTVFAKESGKLSMLAKGTRRPHAKLSGILQPFCCIRFECIEPKGESGLSKLTRAEPLSGGLKSSDPLFLLLAEVAQKLSREGQGNAFFYRLLQDVSNTSVPSRALTIFLIKAVTLYGFLPHFEDCPLCKKRFSTAGFWQPSGEIICQNDAAAGTPLAFDEIKVLRFWQHAEFALCEKVTAPPEMLDKFTRFLIALLEHEHGITLKSKSLLY